MSAIILPRGRVRGRLRPSPPWLGTPEPLTPAVFWLGGCLGAVLTGVLATFGFVAGLGAIAALVLALLVLRYPVLGGYAVVALVPITSGLRRGFPVPELRVSEVVVGAMAVLVLVPAVRRRTARWGMVDWAGFAYAAAAFLLPVSHLATRGEPFAFGAIASMLLPLQFFLIYRTVRTALATKAQRLTAVRLLLAGSVVVAALAIAQQLNLGPARSFMESITAADALDSYGYSVYARATGPFQHWHPLAGYLVVILILLAALLFDTEQRVFSRRVLMVFFAVNASALMLSVTFVSMFGLVAGIALLGVKAKRLRQAVRWTVAGGIAAMVLFGSFVVTRIRNQYDNGVGGRRSSWVPQTLQYRIDVWRDQYLPALDGRWLAGFGPDLPTDAAWSHTESVYITLALRGGLPLLFLFALSMLTVAWVGRRLDGDRERRPYVRALVVLVAVLWFMQLLFPYFTSSGMPQPFWVLVGIALAGYQTNTSSSIKRPTVTTP